MNPLFGRGTLAKQSAGRVYNVDKENITNGSSSAGDTIIRDHLTPLKSPSATRGSVIYRTVGGRATLTPRRRGSKIITTNPLPHLLESVNHRERASTLSSSSSEDSTQPSPLSFAAGSRIQGPTTPQIKLTKKEQRQHRKSLKVMKKELEHGIRSTISQPYNFVHRLHVEEDLTWKDLSGKEALSNLQLVEKLGEGSYGEVYKARAVTGAILVVKVINIKLDNEESFRKEIDILRECSHTNIVPYYGSIYEQDSVWILMEYCALGSLRDLIDISRPLTESEVAVVCFHTLKALIYLHSRNIIHRDVKAANILLNDQAQVKIADFGVSEQFSGHGAESRTSDKVLGTPLWMAPGKYDFKAGAPPFADMNPMRAMRYFNFKIPLRVAFRFVPFHVEPQR
ncbi:serine/threonine kinase [Acanthamoeba castellanii str. Neff]|uniref:non-specific serine/threonine protein kinase n=1 Tax=Acanthamoeba castellanii (strain ATCC 30010 / Neff) TaxID=1257118 RepID=L8GVV0_ACACF|nr:serine/threonine kinase [Acanthamoeba castellanii str. Neff]ELR16728.1 serine/threonine kinase [Acanthamoeba castellanii str. Neff]